MNTRLLIIIACIVGYLIIGFFCDCVAHAISAGDMNTGEDFATIVCWPFVLLGTVIIGIFFLVFCNPLAKLRDKIAKKIRKIFTKVEEEK